MSAKTSKHRFGDGAKAMNEPKEFTFICVLDFGWIRKPHITLILANAGQFLRTQFSKVQKGVSIQQQQNAAEYSGAHQAKENGKVKKPHALPSRRPMLPGEKDSANQIDSRIAFTPGSHWIGGLFILRDGLSGKTIFKDIYPMQFEPERQNRTGQRSEQE